MATRLTSGNVQVRQVGNVPMQQVNQQQTNYMFAANAQAQEANTLARILDDMSNSIGKAAAEKRMEEGQQFVAQNPITAEQVQLAKDGVYVGLGGGIGKISGDLPSYFNAAVRKARGIELNTNFMSEYSNIASQVNAQLEDGSMTIEKAQSILNSAQKGLSSALANVDAGASLQFRAQSGMHGNTVLARGYELELKREKQRREIKFNALWEQAKERIEQTYSRGNLVPFDNIGPVITPEIQVEAIEKQITDAALYFVDKPMQDKMLGEFRKAKTEGRINAVTKELLQNDSYMADPLATLDKIKRGEVGKVSGTLQWMIQNDFDSAAKVTANFMAAVNHRESLKKQQAADDKASDEKSWADLYPQYLRAVEVNDQKTAANLRGRITDIYRKGTGAIPDSLFGSMFEKKQGKGDGVLKLNIQQSIYENKITDFDQIKKYVGKGITAEDASSLYSLLNSTSKNEQKDSDRRLYRLAKLKQTSEGMFILDEQSAEYKKYKALEARRAQIESDAVNDGKPITKSRATEILEQEELSKAKTDEAKSARNQLTTVYEKKSWINGPITRQSMPTLKHKAGNDINKQRDLKRIEELLTQAGE